MLKLNKAPRTKTGIEEAIDAALLDLANYHADDKEYAQAVDQIVKLHALTTNERPDRVSRDTLLTAAANLIGIVVIVGYEQKAVVTSKALGFLPKLVR